MKKVLIWLAVLLIALGLLAPAAMAQEGVQALFINVGKADAALFFIGDARYLVDAGHKDGHDQLARVLEAYGVTHLDAIFVTHTDKDHAGGLKKLFKSGVTTDVIYAPLFHSESSLDDHRTYEAAEQYNVPLTWLKAGEAVDAGSGCVFHVLGPLAQDDENENNNSLVMRLETPHGGMLLAGDMELEAEAALMNAGLIQPAEVLKVSHHGEGDSTSKAFAYAVRAKWAIISTNTEDEPDTPDEDVLENLMGAGSTVAQTQNAEVGILITLTNGEVLAQQIDWQ